jgi:hypothetical protein
MKAPAQFLLLPRSGLRYCPVILSQALGYTLVTNGVMEVLSISFENVNGIVASEKETYLTVLPFLKWLCNYDTALLNMHVIKN